MMDAAEGGAATLGPRPKKSPPPYLTDPPRPEPSHRSTTDRGHRAGPQTPHPRHVPTS